MEGRASRPPRASKGGTAPSRKFHFESFNDRISKLSIDPIGRSGRRDEDMDYQDPTASYFKNGLLHWRELNLSEHFVSFVQEVEPFCDSLPQILHHQERIMTIMWRYLEAGNALSLEPLLNLLENVVHDMGQRFEPYFAKSLLVVTSIASSHSSVEVIEWSFSSLAWLFRYLCRLIVPDIRPTYDIMAPLLGKRKQKPYIARFAAEAMSFLIRKAGLVFHKNRLPLNLIVSHSLGDLSRYRAANHEYSMYQYGIMKLFANAIKGVRHTIHSGGPTIFQCLLDNINDQSGSEVVHGVLINLMHHTDREDVSTLTPILDSIRCFIANQTPGSSELVLVFCIDSLFYLATVRQGSRISDWQLLMESLGLLHDISLGPGRVPGSGELLRLERTTSVLFWTAPLDLVLPKLRAFVGRLLQPRLDGTFIPFCVCFYELSADRFQNLMSPYWHNYVSSHWEAYENEILQWILPLHDSSSTNISTAGVRKKTLPKPWLDKITSDFETQEYSTETIYRLHSYLEVIVRLENDTRSELRIADALLQKLSHLEHPISISSKLARFLFGGAFRFCLGFACHLQAYDRLSWSSILQSTPGLARMPIFLENYASYHKRRGSNKETVQALTATVLRNLSSSSSALRRASWQLLSELHEQISSQEQEILQVALKIEESPTDHKSQRLISMHVRQMASLYGNLPTDSWLKKAISHYCFGFLTFQLSPIWEDAVEALKVVCQDKSGEVIVFELILEWLEAKGGEAHENLRSNKDSMVDGSIRVDEFKCTNAEAVSQRLSKRLEAINRPLEALKTKFESEHEIPGLPEIDLQAQALKVLVGLPWLAEKKSRQLVPILLKWIGEAKAEGAFESVSDTMDDEHDDDTDEGPEHSRINISRKNRKTVLDIIGSFVNPGVLFQAPLVYQALLYQLTVGDNDIQKAALKAVLTWKLAGIRPYQENLLNLLDDARFREEISIFLQNGEDGGIQAQHREELMPVLLRLLYGKVIARAGASKHKASQGIRRRAVFDGLSRFNDADISQFLQIALGPLIHYKIADDGNVIERPSPQADLPLPRQQLGLMNMIKDFILTLGNRALCLVSPLAIAILYCISQSRRSIERTAEDQDLQSQNSLCKGVRQVGIQCLVLLFQHCGSQDLGKFVPIIFQELIDPRFEQFHIETAQSISGTLKLLAVWAASIDTASYLTRYRESLLEKVAQILVVSSAKEDVKLFVLEEILKPLIQHSCSTVPDDSAKISENFNESFMLHTDYILECCGSLLEKSPSKKLLIATIELISSYSALVKGSSQVVRLLEISAFLLEQPSSRISPRLKGGLLRILKHFVPLSDLSATNVLYQRIHKAVSSLFGYFKDRDNRTWLCAVLKSLAEKDQDLEKVASLCEDLNSFSDRALDDPDFDRRLKAYNEINETLFEHFSAKQWAPILSNMLFFIKDNDELAIRSSASLALRRFIDAAARASMTESPLIFLVKDVLVPALKDGFHERSELVRSEYVAVLAHLVRHDSAWNEVNDMNCLLANDDEEASFFNNVLHIQHHRRLRSVRRLANEVEQGNLKSSSIAHFLLPLLEHFIFDRADDSGAHNLAAETISAIATLIPGLDWPQARAIFRRYLSYISSKPDLEKSVIKLLGVWIDALGQAAQVKQQLINAQNKDPAFGEEITIDDSELKLETPSITKRQALSRTMPKPTTLADDLIKNLLPPLLSYLHNKDESTVSLRVPVAVSAVKLLKILPQEELAGRLPPLLTDVCHILRSRAQESRDITRKTLAEISAITGPQYFGFVLKELRSSLARGYQLHVLSYTVHSILVETEALFNPGDLDYCLPQLVAVIMDDIFGITGKEKEAEDYVSKMREVKSSKSLDSMELIAKTASIKSLASLIRPVQALLQERLDHKTVKKIDELFRRMGLGLLKNKSIDSQETLIFCYELIQFVHKAKSASGIQELDPRTKRFLINVKGPKGSQSSRSASQFVYKLERFAFDILRTVLNKFGDLKKPTYLVGFLPAIGDALIQAQEEVQTSALRLLSTTVNVKMKELDANIPTYLSEAVKLVKNTTSTNTELAQAALKFVTAVLREKPDIVVKESDIAYLLTRLRPDLQEPDRQGVTFNFLKSVVGKRMVIPEIYEIMDTVAAMMVTDQSRSARDMARAVYFQFILNLPQGKNRLSKQVSFLTKNLDYKHVEGRQSVMEAIHHLLSKLQDELAQPMLETFFLPLVMVSVNDDSAECRRMAGALLKNLLMQADDDHSEHFLSIMKTWLSQQEQTLLLRASLQLFATLLEIGSSKAGSEATNLRERVVQLLHDGVTDRANIDWEVLYYSLQLTIRLVKSFPEIAFAVDAESLWSVIMECSFVPHSWVKFASAQLLGMYFADFAKANADNQAAQIPLKGSSGLLLDLEGTKRIVRGSLRSLNVPGVGEDLANQLVKNLVFLGRFAPTDTPITPGQPNLMEIVGANTDSSEEEYEENEADDGTHKKVSQSVHQYIFGRLSYILRRELRDNRAPSLISKTAALQLLMALCNRLPLAVIRASVSGILLPLHNLTDPSIPAPSSADDDFNKNYKALVSAAHEVMGLLQKRMGTSEYVNELSIVRAGVKERREGRRVKRRIDAVAAPQKLEREKRRKGERKKERRKEKASDFRSIRRGW